MSEVEHGVLAAAARCALRAPSIFNTQPWLWSIEAHTLQLRADQGRQLSIADPDARMLLLSCGAALHHARVAIAAAGWSARVQRHPDREPGGVLARISLLRPSAVDPRALVLRDAIDRRRTDRRPFSDEQVPTERLAGLSSAAAAEGVDMYRVRPAQMPLLAIAAAAAGAVETADPEYLSELMRWTNRPEWSGDGVPVGTAVRRVPRRVPVREFSFQPDHGLVVEPGGDRGAEYLVLHGGGTGPDDWLRAGEALSAVLLTATEYGLATAPISDVIEVPYSRGLVHGILGRRGEPYIVVRCGVAAYDEALAQTPRRQAAEAIEGLPLS